ncbi:MAG: hypothetical protein WBC37_00375 [Burkholderiaceae bacterium]
MGHKHEHADDAEPPAIQGRRDTGGPWATAWPLLALALIGVMVVSTCVPSQHSSPTTPASPAPTSR